MKFFLSALLFFLLSDLRLTAQKPNILLIIADDCTFSDLPLNGGQNANTPHLDNLASQSLTFDRACLGMAMCSPCRSELYTGCKWTNWDQGLHASLIARLPGTTPAGKRTRAIVQYADILPTLLDLAGQAPALRKFDGNAFADVLSGKSDNHRTHAFGMHNNYPGGPGYPIRSITDGEWRYIRDLTPDRLYLEKHLMGKNDHNPCWQTWVFSSFDKPQHQNLINRFMKRPLFYQLLQRKSKKEQFRRTLIKHTNVIVTDRR